LNPTASIAIIETDLRRLVSVLLSAAHGTDWLEHAAGADRLQTLANRREEEAKRRTPASVPTDLLAYSHLFELRKIIEQRWEKFAPALGEKKEFTVLMDKVEDFRNAPAHSRELLPHEVALLEGISGTIRTKVTAFLSTQSPDAKFYPVIESVRDSFGNTAEAQRPDHTTVITTNLILQVGQQVQFDCRAWDPQGRDLIWQYGVTFAVDGKSLTGPDVSFTWEPTAKDVGRHVYLEIEVRSSGEYHRHTDYDDRVSFCYTVHPPE
jgi:hypothetical protein